MKALAKKLKNFSGNDGLNALLTVEKAPGSTNSGRLVTVDS